MLKVRHNFVIASTVVLFAYSVYAEVYLRFIWRSIITSSTAKSKMLLSGDKVLSSITIIWSFSQMLNYA